MIISRVGSYKCGIYVDGNNVQIIKNTVDQTALDSGILKTPRGMLGIKCYGENLLIKQNKIVFGSSSEYQVIILVRGSFEIEENRVSLYKGKGYQIGICAENGGRIAWNKIRCQNNSLETATGDAQVTGIRLQLANAIPIQARISPAASKAILSTEPIAPYQLNDNPL